MLIISSSPTIAVALQIPAPNRYFLSSFCHTQKYPPFQQESTWGMKKMGLERAFGLCLQ